MAERPTLFFTSAAGFRAWLDANHGTQDGVWLKFAKKGTGIESLSYAGALPEALCYGWIDGQVKRIDDSYYLQSFTPRRARSPWSKRNVGIVTSLIEQGRMHPAGQAEIDRAIADGRWERAYGGRADAEIPADFLAELAKNPAAQAFFETLDKTNKFAVYFRLHDAVKPETRARRIAKFITMFAEGKKLQP